MSAARGWRDGNQHHGPLHYVENPVWHIRGRPHYKSGPNFTGVASHRHPRLSRHDQIKFVRPGMHVSLLRLSRLEAVQAHKHLPTRKQVSLGALVTTERG